MERKTKKEKWFLGNTYHFSIGQGDLALTPIGIHRANLVIANGGKFCDLKVMGETNCQKTKIKMENINLVKEGMKKYACLRRQVRRVEQDLLFLTLVRNIMVLK